MFAANLVKELKLFFRTKGDVLFILFFPILMIAIMSYALQSMVGGSSNLTMDEGKILYIMESEGDTAVNFQLFEKAMEESGNIVFEEKKPSEYESAQREVIEQKAYALITVKNDSYEYYRSPYNEPYIGQIIRSYFNEIVNLNPVEYTASEYVTSEIRSVKTVDSKSYYTIVELTFMLVYIAMIVGKTVFREKEMMTDARIKLSGSSLVTVISSKIALGVILTLVQSAIVYVFSTLVMGMKWGKYTGLMFLLIILLGITVSTFGAVLGTYAGNKVTINNTVLMLALMFGIFGGMFTPISVLESYKVLAVMMKCTPLYWINKALMSLQQGIITQTFWGAVICCGVLSIVLMAVSIAAAKKMTVKEA